VSGSLDDEHAHAAAIFCEECPEAITPFVLIDEGETKSSMCPACITTALLTAVGASSTGGLAALALKKLDWKSKRNHQTEETEGEQNANRNNGTRKNRC
jgi:hypothetical protein